MRYRNLSCLAILLAAGICAAQPAPGIRGYMRPDPATHRLWHEEDRMMPRATFQPLEASGMASAALPAKADVLAFLSYVPKERQQASCGDCWVWASTAMAEVALAAQYGVKDRLSVQFLNSAMTSKFACNGGSLSQFTIWYNTQKKLIPWSNANGAFRDADVNDYCTKSLVDPAEISRTPSYAFTSMTSSLIDPTGKTQDQMIEAIKTAIVNQKAVGLSYYTDFNSADGFGAYWSKQDESALWANAYESGKTWDDANWGGHMVTVVGYNAEDADPAKHYWIVLNSWGGPTNRPNGFFRMPMRMNYQATYTYTDGSSYNCYLFKTLDLNAAPAAPAAPTVQVALSETAPAVMQPLALTAQVTGTGPFTYQWRKNGTPIDGATSALLELPCLSPSDAGQSYDVVVTNPAGTKTSDPVSFTVSGQNLLLNPGMEDQSGWTATSSLGLSPWRIGPDYATLAHSGSGYVYLAGVKSGGTIDTACTFTQKVLVPDQPGSLTLSYWMRSTTSETPDSATTAKDTLALAVLDESGAELQVLKTHSNLDCDHLLWRPERFDLSAYRGRTIHIQAKTAQDSKNYSAFRLDDVGLVLVPPQMGLALSPATATVVHGGTQIFTPTLTGTTSLLSWASAQGGAVPASPTASGAAQAYKAPDSGTADTLTVTAVDAPTATATAAITLVPASAVTVSVSPAAVEMLVGSGTQQFTGTVAPLTNTAITWSGSGVNASGRFSAAGLAGGSYTVTAASLAAPSRSASATVVLVDPSAVRVDVTPGSSTLLVGGTLQLAAAVTGPSLTANRAVSWSTSGGTISDAGLFTGNAAGSFTVTATNPFSGVSGTATVHVKTLDLNADTATDPLDLLVFAKHYGTANTLCDLNGDGTVDDADLALLFAGL